MNIYFPIFIYKSRYVNST